MSDSVLLSDNLFYDNTGSSVFMPDSSDVKVYNNVFYNNQISDYNSDIWMRLDEPLIVRNNLLEDGVYYVGGSAQLVDHNMNCEDSFFADVSQRDFHPVQGSPAIDAGINVGLPYSGDAPDIGVFEYGG